MVKTTIYAAPAIEELVYVAESVLCSSPAYGEGGNAGFDPELGDDYTL